MFKRKDNLNLLNSLIEISAAASLPSDNLRTSFYNSSSCVDDVNR